MKKSKISIVCILVLFIMSSAKNFSISNNELYEKLIGTWKWETIINSTTNENMGLDVITMGMAAEVKTEFKSDQTYIESKRRNGKAEFSTQQGEWKLEGTDVLNLNVKGKWMPSKILKLENDTLLLEMNPQMILMMLKMK